MQKFNFLKWQFSDKIVKIRFLFWRKRSLVFLLRSWPLFDIRFLKDRRFHDTSLTKFISSLSNRKIVNIEDFCQVFVDVHLSATQRRSARNDKTKHTFSISSIPPIKWVFSVFKCIPLTLKNKDKGFELILIYNDWSFVFTLR